jgi:hypothetical protein
MGVCPGAAFGELRTLESNAQTREKKGDEGGDGGVVFDSEMTRLAVDLRRDADGDVFDPSFCHNAVFPVGGTILCPVSALLIACAKGG